MLAPMRAVEFGYGVIRTIRNAGLVTFLSLGLVNAEPITIAALGDSLTQGFGLPAEQGFVPMLEAWLTEQGAEVTLINAGVSGDTTAGGLSRIAWTLTEDVDALIVALGGNDMLRGIDPALVRANLDGILTIAGENDVPVLLIGMDAPSNYGQDYKTAFEASYSELAEQHAVLFHENFLAALAALQDREAAVMKFMQSDRIHPNAAGVRLIVDNIGPSVLALIDRVPSSE